MTWRLDVATLNALWGHAYPKMIGQAWLDDAYQAHFEGSEDAVDAFLKKELKHRGITLGEGVKLRVFASREKNFALTVEGHLYLPNPVLLKPQSAKEIFEAYEIQHSMHRGGRISFPGMSSLSLLAVRVGDGAGARTGGEAVPGHRHLSGGDFRRIMDNLPKELADVWSEGNLTSAAKREDALRTSLRTEAFPFPTTPEMTPNIQEGRLDAYITGDGTTWEFYLPMPAPPSREELFRLFASGDAANPIYTGTV